MRATIGLLIVLSSMGWACRTPAPPPGTASADAGHDGHAPGAPVARTTLLGNLGDYHRPITTTVAEAQRFFDEGLTLLYGFNHEEALRSFARAATLDARAAMPHWGMSLALGTNYNDTATPDRLGVAFRHLSDARARAANGSDVERALIDALATRYVATPNDGQQAAREAAYAEAMGEVSKRFPDDLDAATLSAESRMNLRPWKLYTFSGDPEAGTAEIVATLESVLARNPNHPGANHYHIHAVEASRTPEAAVASAKRLETLVPGAGHLVHMPAHIWMRTGDYIAAAKTNAAAAAIDESYVKATGASGFYPTMYYGHNVQFESAAAMMAGDFETARTTGRKIATLVDPMAGEMAMLQPFALQEVLALVRFGRWNEVLEHPAPPSGRDLQAALYHHARGAAFAATGRLDEAVKALAALDSAAARVTTDTMYSTVNPAPVVLKVAHLDLTARIADARGGGAPAVAAWRAAVAAEDAVGYGEPPDWLLPTREGLGTALMRAGDAKGAEAVYRADLLRNRKNPRTLFGLWKALERQGRRSDAVKVQTDFDIAWASADTTLDDRMFGAPARR